MVKDSLAADKFKSSALALKIQQKQSNRLSCSDIFGSLIFLTKIQVSIPLHEPGGFTLISAGSHGPGEKEDVEDRTPEVSTFPL